MKKVRVEFRNKCAEANTPCWLCGQAIDYEAGQQDYDNGARFQLDHAYPVSTHPQHREDVANFRASHALCNQKRGNKAPSAGLGVLSEDWY